MICIMTDYFLLNLNLTNPNDIASELLKEATEILIVSSRLCLDQGAELVQQVVNLHGFTVKLVEHSAKQISTQERVMHDVNCLELMRYQVDGKRFDVRDCQGLLRKILCEGNEYKEYVEFLTMEIVLKLLKKGQSYEPFKEYLP